MNNKLSRETALRIITSKGLIYEPGLYRAKCTNTTAYVATRGTAKQVAIANFNIKTDYHEKEASRLFGLGDFDGAANQGMSIGILEGQFVPQGGHFVDVCIENKTTSNGVTGLFVTSVMLAPVAQPRIRTMNEFMALVYRTEPVGINMVTDEIAIEPVYSGTDI